MGGVRTVLLADANLMRDYVRAVVEAQGVAIVSAADGEEALRVARERRPDAVVLDVRLLGLDGLSALLRLKGDEATRSIPVMVLSDKPSDDARRIAKAYGADAFLERPFRVGDLASLLSRLLEAAA